MDGIFRIVDARHGRRLLAVIGLALVFLGGLAPGVRADTFWYTDVPLYDQDYFNGACSEDCSPVAGGMVLGWYDAHGWPRMVPAGSNDFELNPLGVMDLVHDLSTTMQYECDFGTYMSDIAPGIELTATNMDPGAVFSTDEPSPLTYDHIKNHLASEGPQVFSATAGMIFHYGTSSQDILGGGHSMAVVGYDDGGTRYGVASRWMKLHMGWGEYASPAWVDEINGTTGIAAYDVRLFPGGTPSPDDDDALEDNDTRPDSATITLGLPYDLQSNDEDWFQFHAYHTSSTIHVSVRSIYTEGNLAIALTDSNGLVIDSSDESTDHELILKQVASSGDFHIKVFSNEGHSNRYILTAAAIPPGEYMPEVDITSHDSDRPYIICQDQISFEGTAAHEDRSISKVYWDNNRGGSGECTGTYTWYANNIPLIEGTNTITFTASSHYPIYGHFNTASIEVIYDPTMSIDNDGDGLPDCLENLSGCLRIDDADTDDDGLPDGVEDADQDGVVDPGETDPCSVDSDGDGLQDGTESGLTNADVGADTDLAVFVPDADPATTTDPRLADTDGDGISDGAEDRDHNGRVDPGERDPNQTEPNAMPWIPLLLIDE